MKTRKAVASRFRVTASGQLKRGRPGRRHILTKKSGKAKRHLASPAFVDDAFLKKYKRMIAV